MMTRVCDLIGSLAGFFWTLVGPQSLFDECISGISLWGEFEKVVISRTQSAFIREANSVPSSHHR